MSTQLCDHGTWESRRPLSATAGGLGDAQTDGCLRRTSILPAPPHRTGHVAMETHEPCFPFLL